jgi:hypothetical protein
VILSFMSVDGRAGCPRALNKFDLIRRTDGDSRSGCASNGRNVDQDVRQLRPFQQPDYVHTHDWTRGSNADFSNDSLGCEACPTQQQPADCGAEHTNNDVANHTRTGSTLDLAREPPRN